MFKCAKPVWVKNKQNEMNIAAVFFEKIESLKETKIYIAASDFYKLYVNGKFVAFGPARTAAGYARVDVISLSDHNKENTVRIEIISYNCRSLSTCNQKGFLTAEIRCEDQVIAYTGKNFTAALMKTKEQYVERFSIQRHFSEIWDMTKSEEPVEWVFTEDIPKYIKRNAPYPQYEDICPLEACIMGEFIDNGQDSESLNCYSWNPIPKFWGVFNENEIELKPYRFLLRQKQFPKKKNVNFPTKIKAGEYAVIDFKQIECGFLRFWGHTDEQTDVIIAYSEYFEGEQFDFIRTGCQPVIECILPKGFNGEWMSFEPYTAKYCMVMVKSGSLTLS